MARRFLRAYAPATREDLARWWGTSPAGAKRLVASLGDEVVEVSVAGGSDGPAWMLASDVPYAAGPAERASSVRLLPAFDPYVIGATKHATALLPDERLRARVYRSQGWISPVLLVEGRMEGVWRHERRGRRLRVTLEPFGKLPARMRREAAGEAERLADFLGGGLELDWAA